MRSGCRLEIIASAVDELLPQYREAFLRKWSAAGRLRR